MAKDDREKPPSGGKKLSEEDLEKTMIDVRFRDIEAEKKPKKEAEAGDLDKTVMVRLPPSDETSAGLRDKTLHGEISDKTQILRPEKVLREEQKAAEQAKAKKEAEEQQKQIEAARKKKKEKVPELPRQPVEAAAAPSVTPVVVSPLYLLLTLVVFLLLAAGLLEAFRSPSPLRLPTIGCTAIAFLFLAGSLLKRISSKEAFLWVSVIWFGWFSYASYFYYTSQATYFLQFTLAQVLGLFFSFVSGMVCFFLIRQKSASALAKLFAVFAFVLVGLALLLSLTAGRSMEGNLWGPVFATKLPLYLRPGALAFLAAFPLQVLAVLLVLPSWERSKGGPGLLKSPALPLLLLAVMGSILGAKLLARQGLNIPLVQRWVGEDFSGSTLIDPNQTSIRMVLIQDKSTNRDEAYPLAVAAANPVAKGNAESSQVMVRNLEGRSFARSDLGNYLSLWRGDLKMKGAKLTLDRERLGLPRALVLLVNISPSDPKAALAVKGAVFQLGRYLSKSDRLLLGGAGGLKELDLGKPSSWEKVIQGTVMGEGGDVASLMTDANKKLGNAPGYKQILVINSADKLPDATKRSEWSEQGKKAKLTLSFLSLGPVKAEEMDIYQAPDPSALGFEILSAAATTLGDYHLEYPKVPPLPKISVSLTPQGQVQIQGGKINFEVLSAKSGDLKALQFKIDNEKAIDLDPAQLSQSIDLELYKIMPGKHQFSIQLITQAGDEVLQSFEGDYVARRPLQFVKPLDKDTIGGVYNVMISAGKAPGVTVQSIELFVDGVSSGVATTEPYLISVDTAKLGVGEHKIQAVQTYADGKTEAIAMTVIVNPSAASVRITRPGNGEYLSNLADIETEIAGGPLAQIQKVDYYVDGQWIGESTQAPHRFLWSNNQFPAGQYFIQARAQLESKVTTTDAVQVQLAQGEMVIQADSAQSPTGELFPDDLEILLDASTSMKEPLGGSLKIDIAKSTLAGLAQTLPKNTKMITRIFGGGVPATHGDCKDSFQLKKPAEELPGVTPLGTSPLAYALTQMKGDLQKTQGSKVGLLITDGWDRCGEDPIEVAQRFSKENKLRLEVIYFSDVGPTEESLLKRLAEVTGGRAYKVTRPEDLVEGIRNAVHVNFKLFDYKNSPVVSQPLSADPFFVRTGEYRLEVDTDPPLIQEGLKVSSGARKTIQVVPEGEKFQLREE